MQRNVAFLIPIVIAALVFLDPPASWFRDGTIYVSPQGSNWNSGRSIDSAVATIQRAADMVSAGETIIILPGVYREEVRVRRGGSADEPVTFKALDPGTVMISGAAPDEMVQRLDWRAEGGKIWSAATPWPIYHAVGDNENFYHVRWANGKGAGVYHWIGTAGRVARLRELVDRPNAWGAFTYEGGRVYVAFPDGRSPRNHKLQVNRAVPRPYASWSIRSANVWVEADHVRFEGLSFFLGVGSGLLLWNAQDVLVRDSMFTGAMFGVSSFPRVRLPRNLIVEHSYYHNYPQLLWRNWLSWPEVYSHHSTSTLISTLGDGVIARNNLVTHAGDGMQLSTPGTSVARGIEIYGNLLANGTDDGLELDGHAMRVHIHDNLVYNFGVSVGISPVLSGPVLIRDNLFLHPVGGTPGAHLKLLNPWQAQGGVLSGPIRNVALEHNVFHGKWLCYCNAPVENVRVEGNVFVGLIEDDRFRLSAGVKKSGNVSRTSLPGSDAPEAACRIKRDAGFPPARHVATFSQVAADSESGSRPVERPGPAWLAYGRYPASRGVHDLVEQWMRVANQCD